MDENVIDELLTRGVEEVLPDRETLKKRLMDGEKLRIKLGIDPTGERIHIGHSVPLLKLRDFQNLGHTVIFIVGDFTAVIGDTSDKESERPMLESSDIERNMASWREQVGKIIDVQKAEFRYNSEWLSELSYREIGEHANIFSLSNFISRENIKRRLDAGSRVSLREVLYPLMQGYDSVAVKADVEVGGSDQRFNLLAGRDLQAHFGQRPQHIMTFALATDASGKKLSKTGGATVYITDDAADMFGKVMSVPDDLMRQYFVSMTRVAMSEVERVVSGHPKEAKMLLAHEIVRMYHGDRAADAARDGFDATFSKGEVPENVQEISLHDGEGDADALVREKIVESKTDYRRLEKAGAITQLSEDNTGRVLKIGKHRFVKIKK